MKYFLMNKDQTLISFATDGSVNGQKGIAYITDDFARADDWKLPFAFTDIQEWLETRKPPEHRKHIKRILIECDAMNYDGLIRVTNGASLNDTFWIKPQDSDLSWDKVSFYRNNFNEQIGQIAFDGGHIHDLSAPTPELSTGGAFAKCWIREQEKTYMLKKSSRTYHNESFSEFYSAQVAKKICKNAVDYELYMYHDEIVSRCENFTDEKNSFVPLDRVVKLKSSDDYLLKMANIYADYGFYDTFRKMMVLDALIFNIDRHFGNAGFLYDSTTMEVKEPAPMFDHNRSLLFDKSDQEIASIRDVRELDIFPRFGIDFNNTANALLTDEIKADLKGLKGFRFKRHPEYNLSEKRIEKLEEFIEQQIDNILDRKLFQFRELSPEIFDLKK